MDNLHLMQHGNQSLIRKGQFHYIYDNGQDFILEDKTKRGLEIRERSIDEKYSVVSEKGMIHDLDGIGHRVGIRWYFPKLKYSLEQVIQLGDEMDARYKSIREMTCPDDI